MELTLKVDIECGLETCASVPGKFCEFFGSIKFGQVSVCRLFPSVDDNPYTILVEKDGWTQRCRRCLDSEL
jgi:hypothetical protein